MHVRLRGGRQGAGRLTRRLCLAGGGLLILFLLLETGARVMVAQFANRSIEIGGRTGWQSRANHRFSGTYRDAAGKPYPVSVTSDEHGFRAFGRIDSERTKILFLGDSFTHAVQVSDSKTFYRQVGKALDAEVFACGVRGYGTLQELMLLEEWAPRIAPDIVVLQFCANDFINNSYELETRSYRNNNGMLRPYYVINYGLTGEASYANPRPLPAILELGSRHSRLVYFVVSRLALRRAARLDARTIEREIDRRGIEMDMFKDAVDTTASILGWFKLRAGKATVLAFNVTEDEPYNHWFRQVTLQHGMTVIEGVPSAMRDAERRGIVTRVADGAHWSEAGHAVAGETIAAFLREHMRGMFREESAVEAKQD